MSRHICHIKYFCLYLENIICISLANTCMSPDNNHWGLAMTLRIARLLPFRPTELLWFCAELPLRPPSLCFPEHSSTQPCQTFALRVSSGGRSCLPYQVWPENLWCLSHYPMNSSKGAQALCFDTGHTSKDKVNSWSGKCISGSEKLPRGG